MSEKISSRATADYEGIMKRAGGKGEDPPWLEERAKMEIWTFKDRLR